MDIEKRHLLISTMILRNTESAQSYIALSTFLFSESFDFSGAVKIIDPLGTSYKMQDYYTAFDAQMSEAYLIKHGEAHQGYMVYQIV